MQKNPLDRLRKVIDSSDKALLEALAKRMSASQEIGVVKRAQHIPPLDAARWKQVLDARVERGAKLGLSPTFINKLYALIHEESLSIQKRS